MNVKIAKLSSGEIVIGEILNIKENEIEFKNLFQLVLVPANQKSMRISITPLHPFATPDEILPIKTQHILFWINNCPPNIVTEYESYVNPSHIIKPKTSGIIV